MVAVLEVFQQSLQAIELGAAAGGDGGHVFPAALSCVLGGGRRVGHGDGLYFGMLLQKLAALAQALVVGDDFSDILQSGAGVGQQSVVHLELDAAYNMEIVLLHQVVDRRHRAGGAIFDGQDAIAAKALPHRLEHPLKLVEIQDGGQRKQLVAGLLGIGALYPLDGHRRLGWKELGRFFQGQPDALLQLRALAESLVLAAAAQVEKGVPQHAGILLVGLAHNLGDPGQHLALPAAVQHRQIVIFFIARHSQRRIHPLGK